MTNEVSVYVCDTAAKALQAKTYLIAQGYADADILLNDQVTTFIYDATKYDGGPNDVQADRWVVIGKK